MSPLRLRIRLRTHVALLLLFLIPVGLLFVQGCEDLLPEYTAPADIFSASFAGVDTDTLEFSEPRDGSGGAIATYSPYYVKFGVKNIYEETIQYTINTKGTLEIRLPSVPSGTSTVTITNSDIIATGAFNSSTNVLTLNPGASIYFRVRIDPKLINGFYLHKYAAERSNTVFSSQYYILRIYNPLTVMGRFSIQLTPNLPAITADEPIAINLKGRFPFSP